MPEARPSEEQPVDTLHDAPRDTEPAVNAETEEPIEVSQVPAEPEAHEETERRPMSAPPPARSTHPTPRPSVQQAIEEVNQIMVSLKETQDLMEEVLEMLEQFERQGNADAREIDSLRRALRHLQRPRDGAHPQRGRP
jgi:hypothetical protein